MIHQDYADHYSKGVVQRSAAGPGKDEHAGVSQGFSNFGQLNGGVQLNLIAV